MINVVARHGISTFSQVKTQGIQIWSAIFVCRVNVEFPSRWGSSLWFHCVWLPPARNGQDQCWKDVPSVFARLRPTGVQDPDHQESRRLQGWNCRTEGLVSYHGTLLLGGNISQSFFRPCFMGIISRRWDGQQFPYLGLRSYTVHSNYEVYKYTAENNDYDGEIDYARVTDEWVS